jgi:threonine synthase
MLYESTRGGGRKISFEEAIIKGIAEDGGLYVPERIPKIDAEFIAALAGMDYADAAAEIIKLYAVNFTEREIAECAARAYNGRSFADPEVTPLRRLDDRVNVLELHHGPTAAFKDVALQLLPPMLTVALKKTDVTDTVAILVATSGDTGKAALEGYRDVPGTRILVFYPKDGVSEAQKLQMITQEGANVAVAAVEGNFDDAQTGVKAIFADADANGRLGEKGLRLSSANSINWGRLMPQIAYYFRAYASFINRGEIENGEPIEFIVPTGNFGNILAGWYAREMGLPVSRFVCASNSNNVLADFINTGVYDRNRDFMVTMSPSMDILISSNLERLIYELSGRDAGYVVRLMGELSRNGRYDAGEAFRNKMAGVFYGGYAGEKETAAAIRETYNRHGYLIDTHTAVGMHVLKEFESDPANREAGGRVGAGATAPRKRGVKNNAGDDIGDQAYDGRICVKRGAKTVVVSTASPFKFARDVYDAISAGDSDASRTSASSENQAVGDMEYIDMLSELSGIPVPESLRGLRDKKIAHTTVTSIGNMKETALDLLAAP